MGTPVDAQVNPQAARPKTRRPVPVLPYLLILPTLVFVAMFTAWPTLQSLYLSLFRQQLNFAKFRNPVFTGLGNYASLFSNTDFQAVLLHTALYVLITVPLSIVLAFLFALLVNRKGRGIGWARLGFFYPTILPLVSAATIWLFLFYPGYGLFNSFLGWFGYLGPQNWTANPNLALLSISLVAVWKNAGFYMIFYLAGIQNLPQDVFEAAALDGANGWQTLWLITFPLLRRTTLFVTTIAFIGAFQSVDQVFVLTQGGPAGASNILLYYLWQVRFSFLNVGQASALTVILIVILLAFTITNFLLSEQSEANHA